VLNVAAGTVRDVIIVKSSGYAALDASIKQALRQWKLRPGKWKEFEIYVGVWSSPDGASR
jgi:TonB family protein